VAARNRRIAPAPYRTVWIHQRGGPVSYPPLVPFSVQLGLLLALVTSLMSVIGFFLKYKGAVKAAPVEWRRPWASTVALFRSPVYTLGCVVATTSWGFHVAALGLAPISLVQSVIAGGLVLVTVVANPLFGQSVSRREWIGVGLTAAGLAFLAATLEGTGDSAHGSYDDLALLIAVGLATVSGLSLAARGRSGPMLAVSAGLLWAGSDVTIKALSGKAGDLGIGVVWHPFAFVIVALSLVGLLVSAKSLQLGPVVPVIALTSATANALTIAAGPAVFGEPLPSGHTALLVRLAAFVLVISAAAMTPPPMGSSPPNAPA
jgi:multidrug transporter EmrE-like cation transporter